MALTFLKDIGRVAGKVGLAAAQAAPGIEAIVGPALGPYGVALAPLVNLASEAILNAHANHALSNVDKKAAVMRTLEAASPAVEEMLKKQGVTVADPAKFTEGASALVDSLVTVMKGMGALTPPPAPTPKQTKIPVQGVMLDHGDGTLELSITWKFADANIDDALRLAADAVNYGVRG